MLKRKYRAATALLLLTFVQNAFAQQTCESRRIEKQRVSATYRLKDPTGQSQRDVVIACTSDDDKVRIALRDHKTRKAIQSLTEEQNQDYLEATTPDLDGDRYADLVLVTSWGSPNTRFKAWRYDPVRDRLILALDGAGTEFVRSENGRIVTIGKGGPDSWGYTLYKWTAGKLIAEYSIGETLDDGECDYLSIVEGSAGQPVTNPRVLEELRLYCGKGSSGLIEHGQDLLSGAVR